MAAPENDGGIDPVSQNEMTAPTHFLRPGKTTFPKQNDGPKITKIHDLEASENDPGKRLSPSRMILVRKSFSQS